MDIEKRLEALQEYIERAKKILELSSPQLEGMENAEEYRIYLQNCFREIGELGQQNVETLNKYLLPLLEPGADLSDDDIELMRRFSSLLIDTTTMENMDLPLLYMQAEIILKKARESGDLRSLILALDNMVIASCMMMNLSMRFYPDMDDCYHYRDIGLKAAYELLDYLPPEKFEALPDDECRELVIINSRYMRCLFEWDDKEDRTAINEEDLRLIKQSLALADDPFYRKIIPNYLWDTHVFRSLQYLADFTVDCNAHNYNKEQLREINEYTRQLVTFLEEHPDIDGCPKNEQEMYMARNSYLAGELSLEDYRKELVRIMYANDMDDFSSRGMFVNFTVPLEYIRTLDRDNLTEEQEQTVRKAYEMLAVYAYRMPKTGVLSFMLTFIIIVLKNYIEVPGGMTFRGMCRQIMSAMHPPTYVHTVSVAAITKYLAEQLIKRQPELFLGVEDTKSVEEIALREEEVINFIYNAALLHDIGKLFIIETILTYGRNLLESEAGFIKVHTVVGASLLKRYPGTAEYADIALGHHRWYDDSQGYPDNFRIKDSKYKTAISLVQAADCLDAATDTIGRSYKQGKSLDAVIEEIKAESGTRYAPYVAELLEEPEVKAELDRLLTVGRDENYRGAYYLLKALRSTD